MKKKFSKSWSFRKDTLFNEIGSKGYELYFNNRWSKINPEEQYWLIIFTKPLSLEFDEKTPEKEKWYTKLWLWDSEENHIVRENIIPYREYILEAYLTSNYVVIKPDLKGLYLLYNMRGELIIETEQLGDTISNSFSTFIDEHTFFCKEDRRLYLYNLDKLDGRSPEKISFYGLNDAKFFASNYSFYLNGSCFAFCAQEECVETSCCLSTLFIYRVDKRNWAHFVTKFISTDGMIDLSLQSIDDCLEISYKKEVREGSNGYKPSDPIVIKLPDMILE